MAFADAVLDVQGRLQHGRKSWVSFFDPPVDDRHLQAVVQSISQTRISFNQQSFADDVLACLAERWLVGRHTAVDGMEKLIEVAAPNGPNLDGAVVVAAEHWGGFRQLHRGGFNVFYRWVVFESDDFGWGCKFPRESSPDDASTFSHHLARLHPLATPVLAVHPCRVRFNAADVGLLRRSQDLDHSRTYLQEFSVLPRSLLERSGIEFLKLLELRSRQRHRGGRCTRGSVWSGRKT